jgi:ectoine hydroxylase-related dioxygenase (phytanoyl-CoA dioxygenase family)
MTVTGMKSHSKLLGGMPWVESPFFEEELAGRCKSPEDERLAREFRQSGYVVLTSVLDAALVEQGADCVDRLYQDEDVRKRGRVQDAWEREPVVKALATDPGVLRVMEFLYGRTPIPFQTLNFLHGSQQRAHADSLHFNSVPARYMCGAWIALEDIGPEQGPLFYFPGSHRLPELDAYRLGQTVDDFDYSTYEDYQEALMASLDLKPVEFHARAGDVLLWSANIVHGGTAISGPGATRRSQVTHYFFDNCLYYTPMFSDIPGGELFLRSALVDISSGRRVRHSFNGRPVSTIRLANGRSRVTIDPTWRERAISGVREVVTGVPETRHRLRTVVGRFVRRVRGRAAA